MTTYAIRMSIRAVVIWYDMVVPRISKRPNSLMAVAINASADFGNYHDQYQSLIASL